jgi:hypothetical protein
MPYKVCFRGDSRHPTALDRMFTAGFQKRNLALPITTRGMGPNAAGDVEPSSAVCISARISAAALFPLFVAQPAPIGPNYMYMMAIDTARVFNTHALQVRTSLASAHLSANPNAVMWPLFAQELAVDSVVAGEVICAVSFTRAFFGASWANGGTYTLGSVILTNPACTVDDTVKSKAMTFLQGEIATHRANQPLPTRAGGFHASTQT